MDVDPSIDFFSLPNKFRSLSFGGHTWQTKKFDEHIFWPCPKTFWLLFEIVNRLMDHSLISIVDILYINSISLSICPGRYILNPCEQGVVFVFNVLSVSLSVSPSVEVLKPRSLLIKLSPRTRGPKNYSGLRIFTSYFYFYVRFRAATVVVDGGGIFGIWKVGEEIWVRFFWAKGLGGS